MRFVCHLVAGGPGRWLARHSSSELGQIEVAAASPDEAVEKLRGEIRYRLELCPCSGESYQHIAVEVVTVGEGPKA